MADDKDEVIENPDPHFEPLVHLPPVQTKTLEEDEEEMVKLRAKLFRYDSQSEPREWKERGTGDVKILHQKNLSACRILMRRDKTLKICANHYVLPHLELKPNCGSDRAWVWSTPADFADEEPKSELLAIRFANAENAQKFKDAFDEAKKIMSKKLANEKGDAATKDTIANSKETDKEKPLEESESKPVTAAEDEVTKQLDKMTVKDDVVKDAKKESTASHEQKKE
jgi:Ran-binding protein 1